MESAGRFPSGKSRLPGSDGSVQQGAGILCLSVAPVPPQSPGSAPLLFAGEVSDVHSILPRGLEGFSVQFFFYPL